MEFTSPLTEAILLKRYKRFLADVAVSKTDRRTIYCPNTGAMRGCNTLGSRVWFTTSTNLRRKYPDTWELVEIDGGYLVAINTQRTNQLILEAIANGTIKEIQGYQNIERAYALTQYNHRFDFRFSDHKHDQSPCFMEVKAVTLGDEICRGFYPDSNAEITTQQLKALIQLKHNGYRAILMYCVQHNGILRVFPADHIDAKYGKTLREAYSAGVEIYAYQVNVDLKSVKIDKKIEVCVPKKTYGTQYHY